MSRGASNQEQKSNLQFINFYGGKFVIRVPEGTEGAEPRALTKGVNQGKEVFEMNYDQYGGQLIDVKTYNGKFGKEWHFFLDVSTKEDPEAKARLSLGYTDSFAARLLSALPNIDLSKDITLKGYRIEQKPEKPGTFKNYLTPYQSGQKILPFYTRDEPKGMPSWEKVTINGVETNDMSKQFAFFEGVVNGLNFIGYKRDQQEAGATAPATEVNTENKPGKAAF
tara:strand:- start:15055 stop:15726 length:672 start_codon:yes stop_codon:yes gene_type:complete